MTQENWRDLLQIASQLRRAGRVHEAIKAYERLLAHRPDLPDSWYNLGWLQRQARQFDDALESYRRALELNVADPQETHLNRAVILSDHLGRPEDALAELEAALAIKADFVPALLNLGNLHEDQGNRTAAKAAYRRALEAAPDNPLALSRLASVSHAAQLDTALVERLRAALRHPGISVADEADLGFALAGLLDAAGCYAEAFGAALAANEASRAGSGARYNRGAAERLVDQLIETFAAPVAASGSDRAPIFIVGMYRSGSTLTEQILDGHSRIRAVGELELVPELVRTIQSYPESVPAADQATIAMWRSVYLTGLAPFTRAGAILTDKRPDNFLHIGLIKSLFPDAKIIHTHRDRLDNLISLHFLHLDPQMAYALDIQDAAHWYQQYERLMSHWKKLYPRDIFDVDYDELVRSPAPLLRRLLDFLELDWEDEILDFTTRKRPVKTASVWQVREPLHSRSSGRWRHYSVQLKQLRGGSGD